MLTIKMSDRTRAEINHLKKEMMMMHTMCEAVRPVQVVTGRNGFLPGGSQLQVEKGTNQSQAPLFKQNQLYFICPQDTHSFRHAEHVQQHTQTHIRTQPKKICAFSLLPPLCLAAKPQSHDTKIPHTLLQLYGIYIFFDRSLFEELELCEKATKTLFFFFFFHVFLSPRLYEKSHVRGK